MPSHLRHQSISSPITATQSRHPQSFSQPPQKKQRMTITQTYLLAHTARGKLSHEAARGDHDLRLLVGHANLLDSLTLELQDAEREQEAWFNETVKASRKPEESKKVQFIDQVARDVEVPDVSDSESDSDSDVDSDDDDFYAQSEKKAASKITVSSRRVRSPPLSATIDEEDDEMEDDDFYLDDDEHNMELTLTRTASHSATPPELVHDSSSDESDDESPLSPPPTIAWTEAQQQGIKTKDFANGLAKPVIAQDALMQRPMVTAY